LVALVGALVESKTRLTKNDGKELRTMTLEEYFVSPPRLVKPPDSKVLWHEDALAEADLLEVRQVLGSATVGLLLDLRQALQIREGSAAVLLVRGVTAIEWQSATTQSGRLAWKIIGSLPLDSEGFSLETSFIWPATLSIKGRRAELYVGNIAGLSAAPPDYVHDDDATICADLPSWTRPFELVTYGVLGR